MNPTLQAINHHHDAIRIHPPENAPLTTLWLWGEAK